ncbi:MAG: peptide transporter [Planctomycetes bacterium]|nr:peptide transporter [Planctomycetota bacterium]
MPRKTRTTDKEVELYRNLLTTPTSFSGGFGWATVLGIIFCGLVMLPGSIYLGLMSGGNLGQAASWVTVILFNEIARRSLKTLNKQNLVILLHAAQVIMAANILFPGGPCAQLVWRAFLVTSDAIRDSNMRGDFPRWWVPDPDSEAILGRNLLHPHWWGPIALLIFTIMLGFVRRYTLGYFCFRLTSDVERLPFPMAPIAAQGAMAMAEADEAGDAQEDPGRVFFDRSKRQQTRKKSRRWRLFSLGATIGVAFGFIQVGIPALTGVFLDKPVFLIPQPFVDTTTLTESALPATPTGIALDLGVILLGMVLPFWAVLGTFTAIVLTLILNPILQDMNILTAWQPGMDTVSTTFANEIDFWMSFSIGASIGLLAVSLFQSMRDIHAKLTLVRAAQVGEAREDVWATPPGRGDFPLWFALVLYVVSGLAVIGVCYALMSQSPLLAGSVRLNVVVFLFVFVFVYNPLISYLNARLLGIAGQNITIPHVREAAFVLSGARGLDIWMAPIPIENYAHQAQAFRITELTGTNLRSMIKTELIAVPMLFLLSLGFWAFIWRSNDVPGPAFPYAQTYWELQSKRTALTFSATHAVSEDQKVDFWQTEFGKAIHPRVIAGGATTVVGLFVILTTLGLPVMFVYGMIRGFGQFPHVMALEICGALVARFYLRRKLGTQNVLQAMPTILAGYFTGVGLIGMAMVAVDLISKAISAAPF